VPACRALAAKLAGLFEYVFVTWEEDEEEDAEPDADA
jgi:hypothetical protein